MFGCHWDTLRNWIDWGIKRAKAEHFLTGAIFPIVECVFVNLLTGAAAGDRWPFVSSLVMIALAHGWILLMQILPSPNFPFQCVADAIEATAKVQKLEQEINRKSQVHKLLRNAVDALNLQTCQIEPMGRDAFVEGLHPIVSTISSDSHAVLGVTTNAFTLEVYCEDDALVVSESCASIGDLKQEYFYSPVATDPCSAIRLGKRSACAWGAHRGVPGTCRVSDDPAFFQENGQFPKDLYFRRLCTVPIFVVCGQDTCGLLVLTAMQDEPFATDVVETMQFIASLISQYIAAHNRCVSEALAVRAARRPPQPHIVKPALPVKPEAKQIPTTPSGTDKQ